MIWHVVFAEDGELPQSRAARSRDAAIQVAYELLNKAYDVRRIIEPDGRCIERVELEMSTVMVGDSLDCEERDER